MQCSAACPMSARLGSPARSAIAIFALAEIGATTIRALWHGSMPSPRACRLSPRPSRAGRVDCGGRFVAVIASSVSDEAIQASDFLDRFAEPVVGPTTSGRSRWLAMTKVSVSELIVHAGAQEIGVERHVVIDESGPAIQSAIEAAEIDIEILD